MMKKTMFRQAGLQKWLIALCIAALAISATACGSSKKKFEPSPIQEGVDVCAVCKMTITDDQHATQIILNSGKSLKFDDIGDLHVWLDKNNQDDINVIYVRDFNTKEWIELEDSFYLYDESFKTPMGFGVYSFKTKADAEKYSSEHGAGKLMNAEELKKHEWKSMMSHDDHDHGEHGGHEEHGEHDTDEHGEHDKHDHESEAATNHK